MATPFDILNQALNTGVLPSEQRLGNIPETKQSVVANKSQEKQEGILGATGQEDFYQSAVNRGTERGVSSMSELERDLHFLSPSELIQRHGLEQGSQLIQTREANQNQFYRDNTRQYDSEREFITDAATNVGLGLTNAIGGIGALVAGIANDEAGATLARGTQRANELVEGIQSVRAEAGRNITEARMSAAMRDSANRAEREQAQIDFNRANTPEDQRRSELSETATDFQTSIKRIGRDILSSAGIATENPAYLAQGTAQGIGSIFAAGLIGKGIGMGASALVPASTQRGAQVAAAIDRANDTRSLVRGVDAAARGSRVPLAIGAMEGGGAYSDVSNQIQNMSFEELEASSPKYRELLAQNMSPEEARLQLANDAGLRAARNVAPLAAATGTLVSRFEGNPLASTSIRNALGNVGREGIEEGIQGGMSGVLSNEAIQEYANENADLAENVGRQIGEGGVLGLTSAGVIQTPGTISNAVKETLGSTDTLERFSNFTGSLVDRANKVREAVDATSPISEDKVVAASQVATEGAEIAADTLRSGITETSSTSEEKLVGDAYVDTLLNSLVVDRATIDDPNIPVSIKEAVGESTNRVEVIQALASKIESASTSQEELELGLGLLNFLEPVMEVSQSTPKVFDQLADDHPAVETLMTYKTLMANVIKSPKVNAALQKADAIMEQIAQEQAVAITDENVNTPEVQQNIAVATAVSERNPSKANLETNEQILFQADKGNLELSANQRAALQSSVNLLRSVRQYQEQAAAMGQSDVSDIVSRQITTDRVNGESIKQSALGFTQQIIGAMRQKDPELAKANLEEFSLFVQHMQNKVNALNKSIDTDSGTKVKYSALMPDRSWRESATGLKVHTGNAKSIELAQKVALEADLLANVYQGMKDSFPELGGRDLSIVSLDQRLIGKPNELAKEFASPQQAPTTSTVTPTESAAETTTVSTEETNLTPEPTVEDTQVDTTPIDTVPSFESIQAMDDATLNEQLNTMQELNQGNNGTAFTREYFNRLNDEMNLREDAAMQEIAAQEQEELTNTAAQIEENVEVVSEQISETVEDSTYTTLVNREADLLNQLEDTELTSNEESLLRSELEGVRNELGRQENFVSESLTPRSMESYFPNLIEGGEMVNMFKKAFKLPKDARTRTTADTQPIQFVRETLSDPGTLAQVIGVDKSKRLTDKAANSYKNYLGNASAIKEQLDAQLQKQLNKKAKTLTSRERRAGRYVDTVLFNILEEQESTFKYNDLLADNAVLAGMQWMLESEKYGSELTDEAIREILGVDPALVPQHVLTSLKEGGMSSADLKRSLANKISQYWGLQANHSESLSYTQGIPEQMAAEIAEALISLDLITVNTLDISPNQDGTKTLNQYSPKRVKKDSPLLSFPTAIENVVLIEPEEINYIGSNVKIPVARTQMRNRLAKNTKQQREAIERKQQVPFYVDTVMVNLVNSLGEGNLVDIFGNGTLDDERKLNAVHRKTLEGQNLTLTDAIDATNRMLEEVKQIASIEGSSIGETPIRYQFNFSSAGRLHMLGKYNPQASKYSRELILPNQATLDLSTETTNDQRKFGLGIAQAIGIKVHNMPWNDAKAKLESKLNNELAPALDVLSNWLMNSDTAQVDNVFRIPSRDVAILKDSLKAGNADSMAAIHALTEYARYQLAEDKSNFRTSLYLEADGVTNGVVNALNILSSGEFTENWKDNVGRGGMYFNTERSLNEHRSQYDNNDLYTVASNYFSEALARQNDAYKNNPVVKNQINNLMNVMETLFSDITFNDEGNLVLDRGVTKNPLTITLYGSGAEGIANNFVSEVSAAIYESMSEALNSNSADIAQVLFPDATNAQERYNSFKASLDALINSKAIIIKGELLINKVSNDQLNVTDLENFEFSKDQLENMSSNLRRLFVEPLRNAIENTVGSDLLQNAELLRISTQVQSIYETQMFHKAIQDKRQTLEQEGVREKSEYLARNELDEIIESLENVSPRLATGNQVFNISGSAKAEDTNYNNFSSSMSGKLRTGPFINGPTNAGVRGIPLTVIGMGDGMMMQYITLEQLEGTLEIFDGMHMPLDKIDEYSRIANEAVYKTWQGNPFRALETSYQSFLDNADLTQLNQDQLDEIGTSILGSEGKGLSTASIISMVKSLLPKIKQRADSIDARHAVVSEMYVSIDQMAAAASPYVNEGVQLDSSITEEEYLQVLNKKYQEKLNELQKVSSENNVNTVNVGIETVSGAYEIPSKSFKKLGRLTKLDPNQSAIHRELVRANVANDYKIVMGTPLQIEEYQRDSGVSVISSKAIIENKVSGFITPENKTVYVTNGTAETLLHEMVHAGTFDTVLAHYNGQLTGTNSVSVSEAINRIEILKDQFLSLDQSDMTETQRVAYENAQSAMLSAESNLDIGEAGAKAIALNEFMAWSLSNAELSQKLRQTKVSKLAQLARDVVDKIKTLIWGNKKAPEVANNMLSTLQFNTAIVMSAQPSLNQRNNSTVLFQSKKYGNSDRLSEVGNTFNKLIGSAVDAYGDSTNTKLNVDMRNAAVAAAELGKRIQANGYSMNKQEESVFQSVVAALTVESKLDPTSMVEVQKLYAHVVKEMPNNIISDANFTADIQLGKKDSSPLLAVFLGLALTNEKFRSEIKRISVPKYLGKSNSSLDNVLGNFAEESMNRLSGQLSGIGGAKDVSEAIDLLADHLQRTVKDRETYIDQLSEGVTGLADRANQIVVDGITALSERVIKQSQATQIDPEKNKYEKSFARATELFASLATEDRAEAVSESVIANVNGLKGFDPLRALLSDITGRTESNASVYDLIKPVRAQIQRIRQNFRKDVPEIIAKKFKRELKDSDWALLTRGLAKTDLAALVDSYSREEALELMSDDLSRKNAIEETLAAISTADPANVQLIDKKSKQLAEYMNTGKPGHNLLRNANAIAGLLNESGANSLTQSEDVINAVDQLVSLYAIDSLSQLDKDNLSLLVQSEAEGMSFTLAYLVGQRKEELNKSVNGRARFNHYKGYIKATPQAGISAIVADDSNYSDLRLKGYTRVGDYTGSKSERSTVKRGYYYMPVSSRASFNQGIFQNAHKTAYGVNAHTGYSENMTAGVISNPADIKRINKLIQREGNTTEPLMAVFDETGQVIAYERAVDTSITDSLLNQETHLGNMIGEWRGRQVEEAKSQIFNEASVDRLKQMYVEHKLSGRDPNEYVNLFDEAYLKKNPIIADAVSLLTGDTVDYIGSVFEDGFYVRKDMLKDAIGYRNASVGDAWTGNTNWSPEVQKTVRNLAISTFGTNAYRYLVNAENIIENVMGEVRTTIVVRSVIIPVVNFMSNAFQLISAGVPIKNITTELPKKLNEIHSYTQSYARMTEAEAELLAASENPTQQKRLQAEIQSIKDRHKRLSIWPLLEAGEFSTVADIGRAVEGTSLTTGKLGEYLEGLADKMPPGLRTAARYGIVSKDTALYQGLQKSVLYGDFISKAVLYDDLVKRQRKSKKKALAQITEEFVNYDVLPGRFRGKLENLGLLWFYNFKIRSAKVAAARMRSNPVHTLMAMTLPGRNMFGDAGLPLEDNVFSKAAEGTLGYSIGPGMAGSAIGLNPWVNIAQ